MRNRLSQEESYGNAGDFAALRGIETGRGEGRVCVRKISHADIRNAIVSCIRGVGLEIDFFIIQLVQ